MMSASVHIVRIESYCILDPDDACPYSTKELAREHWREVLVGTIASALANDDDTKSEEEYEADLTTLDDQDPACLFGEYGEFRCDYGEWPINGSQPDQPAAYRFQHSMLQQD